MSHAFSNEFIHEEKYKDEYVYEPVHEKMNKMTGMPFGHSDQPGY